MIVGTGLAKGRARIVRGVGVTVGVTRRVNQGGRIARSGVGVGVGVVRRVALGVGVLLGVSVRVVIVVVVRVNVGVAVKVADRVGVLTVVDEGVTERVTVVAGRLAVAVAAVEVMVGVSTRVATVVTVGVSTRVSEITTVGVSVRVGEMAIVGVRVRVAVRVGLATGCAFATRPPPRAGKTDERNECNCSKHEECEKIPAKQIETEHRAPPL